MLVTHHLLRAPPAPRLHSALSRNGAPAAGRPPEERERASTPRKSCRLAVPASERQATARFSPRGTAVACDGGGWTDAGAALFADQDRLAQPAARREVGQGEADHDGEPEEAAEEDRAVQERA